MTDGSSPVGVPERERGAALEAGARVGVAGDAALADAVADAGYEPVADWEPGAASDSVEAVVAAGESAVAAACRACPAGPVLPVDAGRGFRSVDAAALDAALEALRDGEWTALAHPVVEVAAGDVAARAAMDATLVTAEPARISEYDVATAARRVATVRADGVVVALPAGSVGYARAAGGPVVAPESGVAAVVPVAPFETDSDDWVVPVGGLSVEVARDETPVELLADDRTVGPVPAGEPVTVERAGTAHTAVVAESRPFF